MPTATAEDTEITLGTGKMLALFFALGQVIEPGRNEARSYPAEVPPSDPYGYETGITFFIFVVQLFSA
jgi:hypothetical protein